MLYSVFKRLHPDKVVCNRLLSVNVLPPFIFTKTTNSQKKRIFAALNRIYLAQFVGKEH
jgi:hypothetical protein